MTTTYQLRVQDWLHQCFGPEIAKDKLERGDRLLEEVLELLQSGGYAQERIHLISSYVFGRPAGDPFQEVGGVMNTLAAYCYAHDLDMVDAAEAEYDRIVQPEIIEKIRAKQKAKPKGSATPNSAQEEFDRVSFYVAENMARLEELRKVLDK